MLIFGFDAVNSYVINEIIENEIGCTISDIYYLEITVNHKTSTFK